MGRNGIDLASLPLRYQAQVSQQLHPQAAIAPAEKRRRVPVGVQIKKEAEEQALLIKWFSVVHRSLGVPDERLLAAVPNGGYRLEGEARKLVGQGVRAGILDLILFVPRGVFHGMAIEMKSLEGEPSAAQLEVRALLMAQGYHVVIAYGFEEARRAIEIYLNPAA